MKKLPKKIEDKIAGQTYSINTTGLSGAEILCFENYILKIDQGAKLNEEYQRLTWLNGRLPVPSVEAFEKEDEYSYLLMQRMPGVMACDEQYLKQPDLLMRLLAEGLKQLWQVDITNCPYNACLDEKLKLAKKQVDEHLCDTENVEEGTYGPNGFENPEALLEWLKTHRPQEKLVFSHGDYCLPNIFLKDHAVSGFIDLGTSGVADLYQDIALCYRSLKHNFDGSYGGPVYSNVDLNLFFEYLDIEPDWEKIHYYIMLDELF